MKNFFTARSVILLLAAAAVLAGGGYALHMYLYKQSIKGKVAISVTVAPSDSTLKVDGKKTRAGKVYVTPGKHTLSAERKYFTTVSKDIDTNTLDKTQTIFLLPKPDSQQAQDYLANHDDVQAQREAAGGVEADKAQQDVSKVGLVTQLPFIAPGFEFTVDYDTQTDNNTGKTKVIIIIKANNDDAKQSARDWITQQGYKLSDLNIQYQNDPSLDSYDNPAIGHQ